MKRILSLLLALVMVSTMLVSCSLGETTVNPIDIIKSLEEEAYNAELLISNEDMNSVAEYYDLELDEATINKIYCVLVIFPLEEYKYPKEEEIAIYVYCNDSEGAEELEEIIDGYVFGDDFGYVITNPIVDRDKTVVRVGSQDTFTKVEDIMSKATK